MLKCAELVEKIPPEALPSLSKAKEVQEPQSKQDKGKQGPAWTPANDKQGTEVKPEQHDAGSHSTHDGREK